MKRKVTMAVWVMGAALLSSCGEPERPVAITFDLSHIEKPFAKIEPFPGVHLGSTYDEVKKLLDSKGVRFETFPQSDQSTGPKSSAIWTILKGKLPGFTEDVTVRVEVSFEDNAVIGFTFKRVLRFWEGSTWGLYATCKHALSTALGNPRVDIHGDNKGEDAVWYEGRTAQVDAGWKPWTVGTTEFHLHLFHLSDAG